MEVSLEPHHNRLMGYGDELHGLVVKAPESAHHSTVYASRLRGTTHQLIIRHGRFVLSTTYGSFSMLSYSAVSVSRC
jgi:hypothetical protein